MTIMTMKFQLKIDQNLTHNAAHRLDAKDGSAKNSDRVNIAFTYFLNWLKLKTNQQPITT